MRVGRHSFPLGWPLQYQSQIIHITMGTWPVRNMFLGHLVSRFGHVPWPPHSPDLSTCDFLEGGGI